MLIDGHYGLFLFNGHSIDRPSDFMLWEGFTGDVGLLLGRLYGDSPIVD